MEGIFSYSPLAIGAIKTFVICWGVSWCVLKAKSTPQCFKIVCCSKLIPLVGATVHSTSVPTAQPAASGVPPPAITVAFTIAITAELNTGNRQIISQFFFMFEFRP